MIKGVKIETTKQIKKFIDFQHNLYKGDGNYVPELYIAQKSFLNKKKNPFFKHSEADFFLAYKGNKIVGRIAVIKNNNYNKHWNSNVGFFGFFDIIDDYEVAKTLLDLAVKWAKERKLDSILGPENFSTNDTCGVLIDGYDSAPVIGMTYNKKYYKDFIEKYGFKKEMDILAYNLESEDMPEKLLRVSNKIEERLNDNGITIRNLDLKNFDSEIEKIKKVYNSAWEKNWGFVPFTDDEYAIMAKDLRKAANTDFAFIAEKGDEVIGVSFTALDLNKALIKLKRGRLFPFGVFRFLKAQKKIDNVRIVILGVTEGYRKLGVDVCFYAKTVKAAKDNNIVRGEASWILETNKMMNDALLDINAKVYKRYRIFKNEI
ncbi:MAG: GNAT family N-acetyltransferase [Bacteroidetes bacterium]|nr:GNAT family N-acetyltransferase [Bacteroidota bacterium]